MTNLKYQNYLQVMEPGYINLSPRDASIISSGCAKTNVKTTKSAGKSLISIFLNSD